MSSQHNAGHNKEILAQLLIRLFMIGGRLVGLSLALRLIPQIKLADAETRYVNSERECLAVVRCLSEVKWLVIGSPYPVMIYSDHMALRDIFIKGDSEKARINGWLDRLGEFDLKLVYRPSTDQHIGIANGLSRMITRHLTIAPDRLGERLSMATLHAQSHPLQILESIPQSSRHQKYKESPLYANVINHLEKGILSLEGLDRNRRRQIIRKAKRYVLSKDGNVPSLCYRESNEALSLCILDSEIERFLAAAHENHGHFAAELSLDFLIGRAYWPTRVSDLERWCGSCHACHACQLKSKRPIKSGVQPIQVFEPMAMIGMDW